MEIVRDFDVDAYWNKKEAELVKKIKKYFISKASMYLSKGKITDEYLIEYGEKKNIINN